MRKSAKLTALLLSALLVSTGLTACGGDGGRGDIELDRPAISVPAPEEKRPITFWGYGDDNEISVFRKLVEEFNAKNAGVIKVNYENETQRQLQRKRAFGSPSEQGESRYSVRR